MPFLASGSASPMNPGRAVGGNLYPAEQRPEQKIDAAVALTMAVGRAVAEAALEGGPSFFSDPLFA